MDGSGNVRQYSNRASELVRFIRNLSQHFTEQRPELRKAIFAVGNKGGEAGLLEAAPLSVEQQEDVVGRCFFGAFPSLVTHLKRAEAASATQQRPPDK